MRLRHPDGQTVYLASVLHSLPDSDLRALFKRLDGTAAPGSETTNLSLCLNPAFASALAGSIGMRRRLQYGLASRGFEVVTLSGVFPHRNWRTWWTHLLDLARVLADLLPEDTTHGSISTSVPVLGEDPWDSAARELDDLSSGLTEIAWHTGSFIRVACELGEGTLLTTIDDGVKLLGSVDPTRIGVCLNPSHLADTSETPAQALLKLRRARLSVIKVRLSDGDVAAPMTQATLGALLGGSHPLCDHFEASTGPALKATQEEFSALGIDGAGERPMPGIGRSL
ncbi:hypothetical protein [Allorhizocola rhizosphaerae]|uniref:hypothetical protein n=1 Tax=Allorhizocola rhizosphaerae TaxID=1872709 RepID=UPI0013C3586B|nr:hypothetical protein [Allorhizocola rhizosphaerae]